MLRPLTSKTLSGRLYTRSQSIEVRLTEILPLSRDQLLERLKVTDRASARYIPSECLVYLLRNEASRGNRAEYFNKLLGVLQQRCARNLAWAISYGALHDAQSVREEILDRFLETLARGLRDEPERLDPFEVSFDKVFAALRMDVYRAQRKRDMAHSEMAAVDGADDENAGSNAVVLKSGEADEHGLSPAEAELFRKALDRSIDSLPEEERTVIELFLQEYPIDSKDPNQPTIAKMCGVSEKTIRNRFKKATERLRAQLQENKP